MSQAIEEKVRNIISDQLGIPLTDIKADSNFIEDLGADSLDIVELIMAMEEEFDAEIPDEEAEKLQTVSDVVNYLNNNT